MNARLDTRKMPKLADPEPYRVVQPVSALGFLLEAIVGSLRVAETKRWATRHNISRNNYCRFACWNPDWQAAYV